MIDLNCANYVMQYLEKTLKLTYEEGIQMLKVQTSSYFLHNLGLLCVATNDHEINLVATSSDLEYESI